MRAYELPHRKISATVLATGLAVAAFVVGGPRPAHAQNLVQDPNFLNGFTDYQTQGDVFVSTGPNGNVAVVFATDTAGPNPSAFNGAFSQVLSTTPGLTYTISFLMNFDPSPPVDSVLVSFGSTTFPIMLQGTQAPPLGTTPPPQGTTPPPEGTTIPPQGTQVPPGFEPFSFTATATDTQTDLSFLAQNGAFATNGLDVEQGAPAPVAGGGVASFCALLAALGARRMLARHLG